MQNELVYHCLNYKDSELLLTFTYDSSMFFGNLFVYFQFQGKTHIDAHTRLSVFIVLLVIAAVGIVFLLLLQPAQSADGEMIQKDEGGPLNALRRAFALLITKEMILLSITFFYTGKLTYGVKFIILLVSCVRNYPCLYAPYNEGIWEMWC
jgi:preprotein translocase subunit SecG